MPEKKKMGRPTDSPKTTQFSIRFDEKTLEVLDTYCKKKIDRSNNIHNRLFWLLWSCPNKKYRANEYSRNWSR